MALRRPTGPLLKRIDVIRFCHTWTIWIITLREPPTPNLWTNFITMTHTSSTVRYNIEDGHLAGRILRGKNQRSVWSYDLMKRSTRTRGSPFLFQSNFMRPLNGMHKMKAQWGDHIVCTKCGYEVPGMILLHAYLYTYSALRGDTFEVLPLSSYAISSTMLPLLETFLELIVLGYGLDDRGFESPEGLGILLFTTASRPTPGSTQSPIQWVPGALSPGDKAADAWSWPLTSI
jgi:hypothetical protein